MFASLKNGQLTKRDFILQTKTKKCESFLKILTKEGFITGYTLEKEKIKIFLKYYRNRRPVINSIKLISKPRKRVYYPIKKIWKISSNKSFIILSTNQGLKSILDCKKLKLGGEPIIAIN